MSGRRMGIRTQRDALLRDAQLPFGDGDGDPVDEVAITTRPPGVGELVAVAVVLNAVRSHQDFATFEQDLERFAGGDTGAKLTGHDCRRAASFLEIHAGLVSQVVAV